jgi:DNA-binding SARP family transcriptional activator/energy-coupling factor transporter ATP-binding protein EcfA2
VAVKVLGPLETGSEPLRPRERAILAALVVRAGVVVSPAELAEAYWGERVPVTWVQQVRTSVAWIRQRLGHEAVETVGPDYRLVIDPEMIDAVRFERLVSSARQHALRGEDDRAIDAYRRALGLWRGAPFVELSGWQPGVVEAMRLDEIRRSAQEELLEARLRAGEHRAVIPEAERLVREEPLREDRWAILALATYRADRQGEALAVLREARRRLADELGVDPGRRLTDLEAGVLHQDPALAPVTVMRQVSRDCPYRGLAAFGPDDAEWFFGREGDVDQLIDRARPGAVVAVAGPSGSGKSSLLLAGVLPRLAGRGRTVRVLRPGHASLVELRDATSADVLAVDQAEELIRAGGDVAAFCEQVWRFARAGGTVLLTVRSDFLDAAAALPHVGAAVGRGVYLLGPLAGDGLREAIVQPAVRAGLRLEPGLVEVVLRDAAGRPGALPHLSHALVETWLRREGATLTVAGYEAAGGIAGAIGQSAEDLYASLGPDERELCRSVMLRLVERVSEGTVVRRRVAAGPLLDDPDRRRVLDRLVAARLVAVDGEAVAIAHEAVATAWPRLAGWLDEDAEGGRLMSALAAVSETWQDGGRVDEDLARGARLAALLEWRDAFHPDLTAVETAFLDASAAREQDEVRTVTERAARDRRQNRRLRASLAGVGALLVVALAAGGVAVVRNGQAAARTPSVRRWSPRRSRCAAPTGTSRRCWPPRRTAAGRTTRAPAPR